MILIITPHWSGSTVYYSLLQMILIITQLRMILIITQLRMILVINKVIPESGITITTRAPRQPLVTN